MSDKGYSDIPEFGKGKEWNKADAERLSHLLVIEEVLAEEVKTGFHNSQVAYVKVFIYHSHRKCLYF